MIEINVYNHNQCFPPVPSIECGGIANKSFPKCQTFAYSQCPPPLAKHHRGNVRYLARSAQSRMWVKSPVLPPKLGRENKYTDCGCDEIFVASMWTFEVPWQCFYGIRLRCGLCVTWFRGRGLLLHVFLTPHSGPLPPYSGPSFI